MWGLLMSHYKDSYETNSIYIYIMESKAVLFFLVTFICIDDIFPRLEGSVLGLEVEVDDLLS